MRLARQTPFPLFLTCAALLCLLEWWIVTSLWFPQNPNLLSFAITIDLVVGIPLLYYLLLVRTEHSPTATLAPILLLAVLIANLILPGEHHTYLDYLEYLVVLVELIILFFALTKVRTMVALYRQVRPQAIYASDALAISVQRVIGESRLAKALVTELSVSFYLLGGWFSSFKLSDSRHLAFPYHRKSGYREILPLLIGLFCVEIFIVHLLIQLWSPLVAWVLTALSIYSLLWIIGDYHASRLQPIVLTGDHLYLRTGLRWRADIPLSAIEGIGKATRTETQGAIYLNAAAFGEPRYLLRLKAPATLHGFLGIQKQATRVGLTVDDGTRLEEELKKRIQDG